MNITVYLGANEGKQPSLKRAVKRNWNLIESGKRTYLRRL